MTKDKLTTSPRRRLEFLDALRGLAAAYVVIYHATLIPQPSLPTPRWLTTLVMGGGSGVTLFFLVSAFSLYFTMPLRLRERHPTRAFYLHRFFRIAPLFYTLLVVTLIRDAVVLNTTHSRVAIASSVLLLFNLNPGHETGIVWASWTIGVEVLFYAAFPLIYRTVRSTSDAIAFLFVCLIAWNVIQAFLIYVPTPATTASIVQWSVFRHLPIFAFGILTFRIYSSFDRDAVEEGRFADVGNSLFVGGVFCFFSSLKGWLPNVFGEPYYWQAVSYSCMFLGLALSPWRLVVNRATCYLGKISYSLYLNHPPVVALLIPVYRWIYTQTPYVTFAFLASVALTFAVVVPLSILTYELIEAPGIALGKSLVRRAQERGVSTTVGAR